MIFQVQMVGTKDTLPVILAQTLIRALFVLLSQ